MKNSKGIRAHKVFRLGKAPARADKRNLRFAAIKKAVPAAPAEFDFDIRHPGIPTPMFGNDSLGDCVIAGRAHQTLRFELIEQGSEIMITDKDVIREYLKESGGADSGLVVLDSLKEWRKRGWRVGRRKYKIEAFAELDRSSHEEIKSAIYTRLGVGLGLALPATAQKQQQTGKPWDYVGGRGSARNSWGGHYVYCPGYTEAGPVCVTWAAKKQMTWSFFDHYCDEAYLIIDAVDAARKVVSARAVESFLKSL